MTWTNAWDETKPADADLANTLGTQGRQVKLDIRERVNSQHIFGQSTSVDGEHRNITITASGITANQEAVKVTGFSLTVANAQSLVDLAGTWNTSGVPTGFKLNITNTASGAGAKLIDLQVGGVSMFSVDLTGHITAAGGSPAPIYTLVTKVALYTILSTDDIVECNGTFTVTLPTAVGRSGKAYFVKNIGTGTITIATTGGQTIDGAATLSVPIQYQSYTVVSNGVNWDIV